MTYVFAIIAAFAFGANWVLQQFEAAKVPSEFQLNPVRMIGHLIRRPIWLLGLATLLVGAGAQQVALANGSLSVDEAVLVLDIVFALTLANRFSRRSVRPTQWAGAVAVCLGLAAFLVSANPSAGDGGGSSRRWIVVLISIAGAATVLSAMGVVRPGKSRAAMFATAAGILFGLSDSLSKAAFSYIGDSAASLVGLLAHWQSYGAMTSAIVGLALGQLAYNAAPLPVSLPSLAVCEPIVGLLVGVAVLHVDFRTSAPATVVEACAAAAVIVGSIAVGRAKVLDIAAEQLPAVAVPTFDSFQEPRRDQGR